VDFELSDDQVAVRDAAAQLLDGQASPAQVRSHLDSGGGLDPTLWRAMVDQGWPGLARPEADGGLGLGWVELATLLEQTGGHVAPTPFLQQVVAVDALQRSETPGLEAVIDRLANGDAIATLGWRPVIAAPDGDGGWLVSGTGEPAVFGPDADYAIVLAHDATDPSGDGVTIGGEVLLLIDLMATRSRPPRQPAMDLTRSLGWLRFERTPALKVGSEELASRFLDAGAVAHSAELLGASARALDLAVEHAKEREQFGRPIGSFQAVKHRCADMLVDIEGMRSAVYYAAWCLAAGDDGSSVAASTAKTWCSDAAKRVMASALQVHGGIGFTWECDVHFLVKRAQLDQIAFGDAAYHRARLGGLLRARVAAGESVI
jgi:alkylation response protein AidB-like acyl-CoA dehydrogenase